MGRRRDVRRSAGQERLEKQSPAEQPRACHRRPRLMCEEGPTAMMTRKGRVVRMVGTGITVRFRPGFTRVGAGVRGQDLGVVVVIHDTDVMD